MQQRGLPRPRMAARGSAAGEALLAVPVEAGSDNALEDVSFRSEESGVLTPLRWLRATVFEHPVRIWKDVGVVVHLAVASHVRRVVVGMDREVYDNTNTFTE